MSETSATESNFRVLRRLYGAPPLRVERAAKREDRGRGKKEKRKYNQGKSQ